MYVTAQESGNPFRMNRRITITLPHSHIGNTSPSSPETRIAAVMFFGSIFASRSDETKTSTSPERSEPSKRKGTPSSSTLRKERATSGGLNVNQFMDGS